MSDAAQQEQIDQGVMETLRERDHTVLSEQINPIDCTHNDIIELLAQYMALSEQDNDELFDDWFDNLNKEQHTVLKVFEVYRGQYEHQN
ncbi:MULTISPECIES: hypothetical protein [Pseudoalteromonas]|jgi:hypothetical protein|uniref:Orphan protein n=3 Tax=Pseudoalteromonas TaxID=53246 RepID=A0AAD0U247_9GAMM|nr:MULTISPECIES: hypothetical protein [Pseudoalteromonas]MDC9522680.1 hypothetical protein [Pseudoalteromonas sp. Angola-31]MDY6889686.1 hypothetical protein [Pseudomonadota bacterium]GEK75380.1 hypothetical protein PAT01_06840 [Pseudoalteromonas atlantica]HAG40189.1 hypothetical protein [Pseudoalteromonas sp.]ATC84598.1 hypothetical protein PAGA_b0741 [Pseudoalteromonas agarivorans DSM 14585]|tara:strand:+ start:164 stop:430 length:267 start_codon:yes stop_codon:yes gene_type:complete